MRVFFNAKQFYRSIFIQLQEFLAFLRNSLRFLLRKVKYDLSKSVQNKKTHRNVGLFVSIKKNISIWIYEKCYIFEHTFRRAKQVKATLNAVLF